MGNAILSFMKKFNKKRLRKILEDLAYAARDGFLNRKSVTETNCVNRAMVEIGEISKK